MGYLRKALSKLFINNKESSDNFNKLSAKKVIFIVLGLNAILVAEVAGIRQEKYTGNSNYKPTTQLVKAFQDKETNVEFVESDSCNNKYVITEVTNLGSRLTVPNQLASQNCGSIYNPLYSYEAIRQFKELKNKNKFRIKYITQGKYIKIIDIKDAGLEGFKTVKKRFSTLNIKNGCLNTISDKYCGLPNIHDGIYEISFLADQDNQIIDIYYLNKEQ